MPTARSVLSLALLTTLTGRLVSCDREPPCGEFPELPYEGTYQIVDADESPVEITSVVVECADLTFTWLDADGAEQWVRYEILWGD